MSSPDPSETRSAGGLLAPIVRLFSSVWFGIALLAVLFVYCTIGSAGIMYPVSLNLFTWDNWNTFEIRTLRGIEKTEYEWFEWWPFNLLMALVALNIIVVTLRRIRFSVVNLGVWMIHSGILILIVGSVIYFTTKVEGDVAVVRRHLTAELPSGEVASMPVFPGNRTSVGEGADRYDLLVADVNPRWPILSGDDAGEEVFSATILVRHGDEEFRRQLLAGHPEYTEDIIASGDPAQPMARAVKVLGTKLVDDELSISLEPEPAHWFYLAHWIQKSWALYLRERLPDGTVGEWVQRPIEGLPIFNDYVASYEDVWVAPGREPPIDRLDLVVEPVPVSAEDDPVHAEKDPLPGVPLHVDSYLRYAQVEKRLVPGGMALNPAASVRLDDGMRAPFDFELEAFQPQRATVDGGFLAMRWVDSVEEQQQVGRFVEPTVTLRVPGTGIEVAEPVRRVSAREPDLPWTELGESGYSYRIEFLVERGEQIPDGLVSVELRAPGREFRRWVFENPARNVDVSATAPEEEHDHSDPDHDHSAHSRDLVPKEFLPFDEGIDIEYTPGSLPAPVMLVAGPGEDDLGVVVNLRTEADGVYHPVQVGELFSLGREQMTLTVMDYEPRNVSQTRPYVVPLEDRERDARVSRSMIKVRFTYMGEDQEAWVNFHQVPIPDTNHVLGRYRYQPTSLRLADGRTVDLVLSRQRHQLPNAVALEDFEVVEHVGGYTGSTNTILNWTSMVRFQEDDGSWTEPQPVSVNAPAEMGELSFFQAEWDPPRASRGGGPMSRGYNLTVLGVGNRHGVWVQLAGCTIAVIGMLYAFYVKPVLRRRRREQSAVRSAAAPAAAPGSRHPGLTPVASVSESST